MAAVLRIGNFIQIPVRLEINDAGKNAVFSFRLTAKRLSVDQWREHFTDQGEHGEQTIKDFLLDHVTGWDGQTLVADEDTHQPAAFASNHSGSLSSRSTSARWFTSHRWRAWRSSSLTG